MIKGGDCAAFDAVEKQPRHGMRIHQRKSSALPLPISLTPPCHSLQHTLTSRPASSTSRWPLSRQLSRAARSSACACAICLDDGVRTRAQRCNAHEVASGTRGGGAGTCRRQRCRLAPRRAESAGLRFPAAIGCALQRHWHFHGSFPMGFGGKRLRFGGWIECHAPCLRRQRC